MSGLEELTLEDIVEELGRRYKHVVVIAEGEAEGKSDENLFQHAYKGGLSGAIGLVERYRGQLKAWVKECREEAEE